jgi:hypothetical protein
MTDTHDPFVIYESRRGKNKRKNRNGNNNNFKKTEERRDRFKKKVGKGVVNALKNANSDKLNDDHSSLIIPIEGEGVTTLTSVNNNNKQKPTPVSTSNSEIYLMKHVSYQGDMDLKGEERKDPFMVYLIANYIFTDLFSKDNFETFPSYDNKDDAIENSLVLFQILESGKFEDFLMEALSDTDDFYQDIDEKDSKHVEISKSVKKLATTHPLTRGLMRFGHFITPNIISNITMSDNSKKFINRPVHTVLKNREQKKRDNNENDVRIRLRSLRESFERYNKHINNQTEDKVRISNSGGVMKHFSSKSLEKYRKSLENIHTFFVKNLNYGTTNHITQTDISNLVTSVGRYTKPQTANPFDDKNLIRNSLVFRDVENIFTEVFQTWVSSFNIDVMSLIGSENYNEGGQEKDDINKKKHYNIFRSHEKDLTKIFLKDMYAYIVHVISHDYHSRKHKIKDFEPLLLSVYNLVQVERHNPNNFIVDNEIQTTIKDKVESYVSRMVRLSDMKHNVHTNIGVDNLSKRFDDNYDSIYTNKAFMRQKASFNFPPNVPEDIKNRAVQMINLYSVRRDNLRSITGARSDIGLPLDFSIGESNDGEFRLFKTGDNRLGEYFYDLFSRGLYIRGSDMVDKPRKFFINEGITKKFKNNPEYKKIFKDLYEYSYNMRHIKNSTAKTTITDNLKRFLMGLQKSILEIGEIKGENPTLDDNEPNIVRLNLHLGDVEFKNNKIIDIAISNKNLLFSHLFVKVLLIYYTHELDYIVGYIKNRVFEIGTHLLDVPDSIITDLTLSEYHMKFLEFMENMIDTKGQGNSILDEIQHIETMIKNEITHDRFYEDYVNGRFSTIGCYKADGTEDGGNHTLFGDPSKIHKKSSDRVDRYMFLFAMLGVSLDSGDPTFPDHSSPQPPYRKIRTEALSRVQNDDHGTTPATTKILQSVFYVDFVKHIFFCRESRGNGGGVRGEGFYHMLWSNGDDNRHVYGDVTRTTKDNGNKKIVSIHRYENLIKTIKSKDSTFSTANYDHLEDVIIHSIQNELLPLFFEKLGYKLNVYTGRNVEMSRLSSKAYALSDNVDGNHGGGTSLGGKKPESFENHPLAVFRDEKIQVGGERQINSFRGKKPSLNDPLNLDKIINAEDVSVLVVSSETMDVLVDVLYSISGTLTITKQDLEDKMDHFKKFFHLDDMNIAVYDKNSDKIYMSTMNDTKEYNNNSFVVSSTAKKRRDFFVGSGKNPRECQTDGKGLYCDVIKLRDKKMDMLMKSSQNEKSNKNNNNTNNNHRSNQYNL